MSFKINLARIPREPRTVVKDHLSKMILQLYNRDYSYAQIGKFLGVNRERVRQLDREMNGRQDGG